MPNPSDDTLFTEHAADDLESLIQYDRFRMTSRMVAVGYADAARRLDASYEGEPWDDVMLLPFLFLWRQALELQLKVNIRELAQLRRREGDTDDWLSAPTVEARLRSPRKVGHNLTKLTAEHDLHLAALEAPEIPDRVTRTLRLLAALDDGGTAFRYSGVLAAPSSDIDFVSLAKALSDTFSLLHVVIDAVTNGEGV